MAHAELMAKKPVEKKPSVIGRPRQIRDWVLIDKILSLGGRMPQVCYLTGVSKFTITEWIREEHDMTFSEYRESRLSGTVLKIFEKQLEVAMKGDVQMLKHVGEHLGGQVPKAQNLVATSTVEDFIRSAKEQDE